MKKESENKNVNPEFKLLLEQALKEMGLSSGYEEQQIVLAFKRNLPLSFQKYITQINYKGGILFVRCHSAALKNELQLGKEKLIGKINDQLKEVKVKELRVF